MSSLALSLVLQMAVVSAAPETVTYDDAYRQSGETGQPLIVLVGADWCPACQTMKSSVIPQVSRRGILRKVVFAQINTDRQSGLANRLMSGGSIPQLVMYYKTPAGWKRTQLTGAQSVTSVEQFIDKGVQNSLLAEKTDGSATVEK